MEEVLEKQSMHAHLVKNRMELSAIPTVIQGSMELVPCAGNLAHQVTLIPVLTV
jgi:hypothetical protein